MYCDFTAPIARCFLDMIMLGECTELYCDGAWPTVVWLLDQPQPLQHQLIEPAVVLGGRQVIQQNNGFSNPVV